jgi:glycine cleavage system aminomethyltransferase T
MSLDFPGPPEAEDGAVARSPMERMAKAAGARFEVRHGWNVPVDYGSGSVPPGPVAWADVSHLRKWEVRGEGVGGELGTARREDEAWWCGVTAQRALVLGGPPPAAALDLTTCFAALVLVGPQARETIARFCALDLRPGVAPPGSFRPGSIARQPGMIVVEDADRFLLLFGWAIGEYMWTVVEDAARSFGGRPVGLESLRDA